MVWRKKTMENKVLVELVVPIIEKQYDIYLPVNRRVGNAIGLIIKGINEFNNGDYEFDSSISLYNSFTGVKYNNNDLIRKTDIRNGSKLILM
jgi:hypothetical protein